MPISMCALMSLLVHVCLLAGKREEGQRREEESRGGGTRVVGLTWLEGRGDTTLKKKGTRGRGGLSEGGNK